MRFDWYRFGCGCLMSAALGMLLLALTACAHAPAPPPTTRTACLPMAEYSRAEQDKAADELEALPSNSQVGRMVVDYGTLRAANRAACNPPH